ncbi:MAG: MMPL family transporter, partial [Lachnospiraceae bacterium]|nr:MMPL family transporter [Lachnospiraceae bacterium]
QRTKHRPLIKSADKASEFTIKYHWIWFGIFLVLLIPAIHGSSNNSIYYDIAKSLPSSLPSNQATEKIKNDFDMSTLHMVMMDKNMEAKDKKAMIDQIEDVKGVKWCISLNSLVGPSVPESMIPEDLKSMLQSDDHEMAFICSEYESATPEVNKQIARINKITKSYDKGSMVIGEAPLMKDLEDVTDVDIQNVNIASVAAIFVIILIVFKSISLPVILVAVIEFAIAVNMAVPYYQGVSLPFVASIVIGTIQLGATVDYAIVYTNRYLKERRNGKQKLDAVMTAHKTNMLSIITSALSLFGATYGVACYSKVDMIGAICTLLARGALISMIVVLTLLPTMFLIFDKVICKTTVGMGHIDKNAGVVNDSMVSQIHRG